MVLMRASRIAIVTDSNVGPLYAERVKKSLEDARFQVKVITIPAGETSKSPAMLAHLWEELMSFGMTRTDAVVALGGGVVGDLAGFAAATILRGIDYVQIPTTLLAQVDSSVGGKVAVDLNAGKNLAGAFWQPRMVIMDPDVLDTLPDETFSDGMAEVIKYGCIWDAEFFDMLAQCGNRAGVMAVIENVLHICCAIKAEVVLQDEHDMGLRMILNYGHTLGHAYEKAYQYEKYTHGQGMPLAAFSCFEQDSSSSSADALSVSLLYSDHTHSGDSQSSSCIVLYRDNSGIPPADAELFCPAPALFSDCSLYVPFDRRH
ncbi:MAG: 3-dehydroquinate synthase [Oscillospiraceae bacterium]|nr:3-dehydroquinate synthase [Oscillospiraceae bacterium]